MTGGAEAGTAKAWGAGVCSAVGAGLTGLAISDDNGAAATEGVAVSMAATTGIETAAEMTSGCAAGVDEEASVLADAVACDVASA